jgi:MFS family permease
MFVIWLIPEAVAQNLATVIVGRFFDGFAGSAFLAVAAGSVVEFVRPIGNRLSNDDLFSFTLSGPRWWSRYRWIHQSVHFVVCYPPPKKCPVYWLRT